MNKPMRGLKHFLLALATLSLLACADDPELAPATPLQTDNAVIAQLYGAMPGAHQVSVIRDLQLAGGENERDLVLNLYFPGQGESFPLVLFSHGNWSDKDSYDHMIKHWVSHGYAVIAPNHLDCCSAVQGIFNSLRFGQVGLVEARITDMSRILRDLPRLEQTAPAFAGKADSARLGLAGHSFGAFTAQQFGGARVFDPDKDSYLSHLDPRVKAVVAMSPPGPMFDTITAGSWLTLATPTLVSTGTWDVQPRFWPDWRMHLMSWETAIPGDKYALVTDGADHYLGNLICRPEREAAPQEDALRMVQIATTAFLDSYLKDDIAAREFISDGSLNESTGGFAKLTLR
jgi:predicted dienelactone hydrolase